MAAAWVTSTAPLATKLHLKPGHRVLLVNAPAGYPERLDPLPDGAKVSTAAAPGETFDAVQLFVRTKAELDREAVAAIKAVMPGGLLWISYPKRSSKVDTDLTRDIGWQTLTEAGWTGVAQVAIDDVWSATRFRPAADVGHRNRGQTTTGKADSAEARLA